MSLRPLRTLSWPRIFHAHGLKVSWLTNQSELHLTANSKGTVEAESTARCGSFFHVVRARGV